jgi:hypothetical protein
MFADFLLPEETGEARIRASTAALLPFIYGLMGWVQEAASNLPSGNFLFSSH